MCAERAPRRPRDFGRAAQLLETLPPHLKRWTVAPGGCWIAEKRSKQSGYAYATSWAGKKGTQYKLIWEHLNGPVPPGLELDHLCDNGAGGCVNPFHLRACTHRENMLRPDHTLASQQLKRTHCPKGHPYSGDNLILQKRRDGVDRECRTCKRERVRRWQKENPERWKELRRKYEQSEKGQAARKAKQARYRERKRAKRAEREAS